MHKTLTIAAAALALFAGSAVADGFDWNAPDVAGGSFHGSASAFSASGGFSIGNGRSMSEAGQFAGVTTTLNFDPRHGEGDSRDGFTATGSVDTFTSGFDRARSRGHAIGGAIRGGVAFGESRFGGLGSDSW